MSKLRLISGAAMLLCIGVLSLKQAHSKRKVAPINYGRHLAKAQGPVFTEIVEKSVAGDIISLDGQVHTKLSGVNVEWELPGGATIVEGNASEVLQPDSNGIAHSLVKIRVGSTLSKPHAVFEASANQRGQNLGHASLYRLAEPDPGLDEEQIEMMKQHFKYHRKKMIK